MTQAKGTTVRDLAAVAGPLGVTHLCLFTRSEIATYMKLAKFPRGPTLTFRSELSAFSLSGLFSNKVIFHLFVMVSCDSVQW